MKHLRTHTILLGLALLLLASAVPDKTTTIFIIGDSTAANKDISGGKQERGWGMALQCYFDDHIRVSNHAVNGRSSLSFINEGRWDKVLQQLKPGDYVIIQFGHNDEKAPADRHTDPGSTFDYNLAKYVRETREHGGIPILMNAVVRRNFEEKTETSPTTSPGPSEGGGTLGAQIDDEALRQTTNQSPPPSEGMGEVPGEVVPLLIDTHGLYRQSPRDVARRMNVHFVDANQITHDLEQGLGFEASKQLHMWYLPGQEPSLPKGRQDNTHYNVHGAHVVARLLADALCAEIPVLAPFRTDADITVDAQGRGDYLTLDEAIRAAQASSRPETTIQLLGGQWPKPQLPKKSRIRLVLRQDATWK